MIPFPLAILCGAEVDDEEEDKVNCGEPIGIDGAICNCHSPEEFFDSLEDDDTRIEYIIGDEVHIKFINERMGYNYDLHMRYGGLNDDISAYLELVDYMNESYS